MTKKLIQLILTIIYSTLCCSVYSQIDTEFWFAAPEISQFGINNTDRPIVFRFTTQTQSAIVTVTQPAGTYNQTITIPANSTYTLDLTDSINTIENKPPNTILNYGFKITSTTPITAYYEVVSGLNYIAANNPEAFVLKGDNALGTEFWIPSQNLVFNYNLNPTPYNSFDIVATEDNTNIIITPSNDIFGHLANIPFTITLNTGQTYSATATSQAALLHLNGSYVIADKPIAITVKDDLLMGTIFGGGCGDLTGDQIVPLTKIGVEYIAIKGLLNTPGDYIFVTATQNATTIDKDGVLIATINAGQTHSFPIGSNLSTYIETSAPAYVWQLSGSGCELGATILPQINCSGSNSVSYTRSSNYLLYLNLLVQSGSEGNFTVNGNNNVVVASQFTPVPATGGNWLAASVLLPLAQYPQNSVINVSNSSSNFHLSTIDINGGGTSYAYFSNYSSIDLTAYVDTPVCSETSMIQFYANSNAALNYLWTGPNNFFSSLQNPAIIDATVLHTGYYTVTVDSMGCSNSITMFVDASNCNCVVDAGYNVNQNNPMQIDFWGAGMLAGGNYNWDFGDGSPQQTTTNTLTNHTYTAIGTYTVKLTYSTDNGRICYDSFDVTLKEENSISNNKYSDVIFSLYPNPANSEINITMHKNQENLGLIDINVIDIYGKLISSYQRKLDKQTNEITIPVYELANGMYFIEVVNSAVRMNKKFVKW